MLRGQQLRIDAFPRDLALLGSGYMFGEDGVRPGLRFSLTGPVRVFGTEIAPKYLAVGIGLGASYGVTDHLEVGAVALPLYLTGNLTAGSFNSGPPRSGGLGGIPLYARYAFVDTSAVQVGVQVAVRLLDWGFQAGIPVNLLIAETFRLETGVAFEATQYGNDTDVEYGLTLPVAGSVAFGQSEQVHVGARLALTYRPDASSFAGGAFGGYLIDLSDDVHLQLQGAFSLRSLKGVDGPSAEIIVGASMWFDP